MEVTRYGPAHTIATALPLFLGRHHLLSKCNKRPQSRLPGTGISETILLVGQNQRSGFPTLQTLGAQATEIWTDFPTGKIAWHCRNSETPLHVTLELGWRMAAPAEHVPLGRELYLHRHQRGDGRLGSLGAGLKLSRPLEGPFPPFPPHASQEWE